MKSIIINKKVFKFYDSTYYVSADGEIYSTYSKKILKPSVDLDGYLRVDIHGKHAKVHKLVYTTWIGSLKKGEQVNHKDDNKLNNNYCNLYAGSQKENTKDRISNGHNVGNIYYFTVFDKQENKVITFCPSSDFIKYCGHPSGNGSIKRFFSRNWFQKRYEIIEFKNINNLMELKSVTTMSDECSSVE